MDIYGCRAAGPSPPGGWGAPGRRTLPAGPGLHGRQFGKEVFARGHIYMYIYCIYLISPFNIFVYVYLYLYIYVYVYLYIYIYLISPFGGRHRFIPHHGPSVARPANRTA